MKGLLVTRVFNKVAGDFVCLDCGLEYPFRQWPRVCGSRVCSWQRKTMEATPPKPPPEFYTACPHCGGTNKEIGGSDLVFQEDYPWKHLDGYVESVILCGSALWPRGVS